MNKVSPELKDKRVYLAPYHKPCPDMAGMVCADPEKLKRSRFLLQKLREKHGLDKSKPKQGLNVNALEWGEL